MTPKSAPSTPELRDSACRPTIYVVEDDDDVRGLLGRACGLLDAEVLTFGRAEEFLEVVDTGAHGCLLLDYRLPGRDGLEIQRELRARNIGLPVVFVSGAAEVSTAVAALKAGSVDFLEKPFCLDQLLEVTRRALRRDAEARRARARRESLSSRLRSLTPRERQVLGRIVAGSTSREIGAELGLSPKTVDHHRASLMRKLRTHSVAALVRLVVGMGAA